METGKPILNDEPIEKTKSNEGKTEKIKKLQSREGHNKQRKKVLEKIVIHPKDEEHLASLLKIVRSLEGNYSCI